MIDSLELTFAELSFLIEDWPQDVRDIVVDQLRLPSSDEFADLQRSGYASLAVRELLAEHDGATEPIDELKVVLVCLRTAERWVRVAGASEGQPRGVIVAAGPELSLVIVPVGWRTYRFALLAPGAELGAEIARSVDTLLADRPDSLALVRVRAGDAESRLGVAIDGAGQWLISDSVQSPDRAVPTTQAQALARVADVASSSVA